VPRGEQEKQAISEWKASTGRGADDEKTTMGEEGMGDSEEINSRI
jgi:hypothetical protein